MASSVAKRRGMTSLVEERQVVIIAWIVGTISVVQCEDKVGFVYELVRHGARAPILNGEQ